MEDFIKKVIDMCTVEDLIKGYIYDTNHGVFTCIFCGEIYEEDLIYKCDEQLFNAKRAIEMHILEKHKSPFDFLLDLEKKYTGLSERQKEIFNIFYSEEDNQLAAEKMKTTPATVRSYKFKMHEKLRQAKIYMALSYLIELENVYDNASNVGKIRDIAVDEKIKSIQKDTKEKEKDYDVEKILNKKVKGVDLNLMNPFIDKGRPGTK